LIGLFLSPLAAVLADDATDIIAMVLRDTPKRADAAKKLLDMAKSLADSPAVQVRFCEVAYEQGMTNTAGFATAIAALDMLEELAPTRMTFWNAKRLEAHRKQYYRSAGADKTKSGRLYVSLLLERGKAAGRISDWKAAVAHYQQAYNVARALKLPEKQAISDDLRAAADHKMVHNRVKVLKAALAKDPDDLASRRQLVMTLIVDLDQPHEAVKYVNPKLDAALVRNLTLAAKESAELAGADLLTLGIWYRSLAAQTPLKHTKVRMHTRALDNLNLCLEVYTKQDAQRLRASMQLTLVKAELKKLRPEPTPTVIKKPPVKPPSTTKQPPKAKRVYRCPICRESIPMRTLRDRFDHYRKVHGRRM